MSTINPTCKEYSTEIYSSRGKQNFTACPITISAVLRNFRIFDSIHLSAPHCKHLTQQKTILVSLENFDNAPIKVNTIIVTTFVASGN